MASESIVVRGNPVTAWEKFNHVIPVGAILEDSLKLVERDMGGYISCQYVIETEDRQLAIDYLNNGPGRDVTVWNDRGNLDWEGFVNRVTIDRGRVRVANWLDRMENKVWTRYQPLGGGAVTRSTVYQNAASQARFGIKEGIINGGQLGASEAAQKANTHLQQVFWATPEIEAIDLEADAEERLRLVFSCLGYWFTFGWRTYNQTALTGTDTATAIVSAIVTATGQFVRASELATNGTPVTKEYDADRRPHEIIESICELGDANLRLWVAGFGANRTFYFREAAPSALII